MAIQTPMPLKPRVPLHPGHTTVAPIHVPAAGSCLFPSPKDLQVKAILNGTKQGINRLQMTAMMGQLPPADVVDVLNQMLTTIEYVLQRGT